MREGRERKRRLSNEGKRSVHIKWDGKTIALGTFPDKEASIVCKQARVLTKTWRLVDPKPNVVEVKHSLERLGIRVVNDRPGRQSKKKNSTTPNQKRHNIMDEEGISAVYGVSAAIVTPPHAIATAMINQHPPADSIVNIAEKGTPSLPSYTSFQTDALMIPPKEITSSLVKPSFTPSHINMPICSYHGSNYPIVAPMNNIEADSEIQGVEQVVHPDMELHSNMTYQMLEDHYLNVQNEMEQIKNLMIFHKQRQLKQKNEKLMIQRVGKQTDPTLIQQINNSPIQSYQDYKKDELELSETEEMVEVQILMSDTEDNDSITQMILLEDW